MSETFYWHDYETFGVSPSRDRPCQFAGLRTDANLVPVGDPTVLYCRPTPDYLPSPMACLVTGITPQEALQKGLTEREFIARIHAELAHPRTCGVGYNSLRFDDEVTRYTLYRNFYDPYAREYQEGNSRWDLIDMVRACYALRPEGIEWPMTPEGLVSVKLEALTAANAIEHSGAHDALVDVKATIELARLIRQAQPKLYEYALAQRDKHRVLQQLALGEWRPVLHVSGMFGAKHANLGLVVPVLQHPRNKNEVIALDLSQSPQELLRYSADELRARLYARSEDLEGARPALKSIHINRSPLTMPAKMLTPEVAARAQLDLVALRDNLKQLQALVKADADQVLALIKGVYDVAREPQSTDPEWDLYGGFFGEGDRQLMDRVRASPGASLAKQSFPFEDPRLPDLLFRYRARNFPESLGSEERSHWQEYCFERITRDDLGVLHLERLLEEIAVIREVSADDPKAMRLMDSLEAYTDTLLAQE